MECWKENLETFTGNQIGTWGYSAGSGSGASAVALTGSKRVLGIRVRAGSPVTFNVDGGDTVTLIRNEIWIDNPLGNLVDPTVNFLTGTWQYTIEYVT